MCRDEERAAQAVEVLLAAVERVKHGRRALDHVIRVSSRLLR